MAVKSIIKQKFMIAENQQSTSFRELFTINGAQKLNENRVINNWTPQFNNKHMEKREQDKFLSNCDQKAARRKEVKRKRRYLKRMINQYKSTFVSLQS